ncbi:MAG: SMP-30/gluconolactonase/LRE family protein [Steroidobacteraceae bacterium]
MRVEVVWNDGAAIGEAPTWASAERVLYWIDVKKPALYRYDPVTGRQRSWSVRHDIGAFALLAESVGAVVALREGIFRLDFTDGTLVRLAPPPFDPTLFRFNEGACDSAGRFWIGVMFDPLDGKPPAQPASLHRFTLGGGLVPQPDAAELHNGMAWSREETLFYLAHSRTGEVFAYTFDARRGQIGPRKLFAKVAGTHGIPDGAAVDTEGGYWCALHGGGRLRRYTETGDIDRDISLPVSQPTMCAFGGEALADLYITSASDGLSAEQRRREPLAGALLRVRCGARGIPRPCEVR